MIYWTLFRAKTLVVFTLFQSVFVDVHCLRVTGVWSPKDSWISVVAKFGFQQTDDMQAKETRGYVYGNVTTAEAPFRHHRFLLALVNSEHFRRIYAHRHLVSSSEKDTFCSIALKAVSEAAFEARCAPNGRQDFFRKIPCEKDHLCSEEDDPFNVVDGYQLTYHIQDKAQARFWYVVLLNCHLDQHCNWTSSDSITDIGKNEDEEEPLNALNGTVSDRILTGPLRIYYDLWLVNGDPQGRRRNPFEHQFSYDRMDTFEIYLAAMFVTLILISLQWRAYNTYRSRRGKFLLAILAVQAVQIGCNIIYAGIFASNGRGLAFFRTLGDLLELAADYLLILLLICIAKGWTINAAHVTNRSALTIASLIYCVSLVIFYFWSVNATDELLDVGQYQTWPGWAMLLLRVLAVAVFLAELRRSIRAEYEDAKVSFLLHFGAGFLVWFIYLPVLGALSSYISVMWRYKILLSISYLADFVACAVLIHVFWPNSTNRNYFLKNTSGSSTQEDMDDFEKAIIMEDLDSITHVEESKFRNGTLTHST